MSATANVVRYLDPHALQVVQAIDQASDIPSMPQLICHGVMFENSAIGVIVGWIAIDEPIEEEGIEREAPVRRRLVVGVVIPLPPVIDGIDGGAVLVEVEADLSLIEPESRRGQAKGRQQRAHRAPQHGVARLDVPIGTCLWTSGGERDGCGVESRWLGIQIGQKTQSSHRNNER